jgi:hypothetical protein
VADERTGVLRIGYIDVLRMQTTPTKSLGELARGHICAAVQALTDIRRHFVVARAGLVRFTGPTLDPLDSEALVAVDCAPRRNKGRRRSIRRE